MRRDCFLIPHSVAGAVLVPGHDGSDCEVAPNRRSHIGRFLMRAEHLFGLELAKLHDSECIAGFDRLKSCAFFSLLSWSERAVS